MQPIAKNPFRIALLCAAGLLPSQLRAESIVAHPDDAEFQTNASAQVTSGPVAQSGRGVFIGRQYYADNIGHLVVPFQLPDLGEGVFSNVSLSFYTNESSDEPRPKTNVNLWAIQGSRNSSATLQSDVRDGVTDHTANGTLVKQNFLNNSTTTNAYTQTPAGGGEAALLESWLNAAYGNGDKAGNFVFVRLSPAALTPNQVASYDGPDTGTGFQVSTGNAVGYFLAAPPLLNYTFTPADPNAPAISSFKAVPSTVGPGETSLLSWTTGGEATLVIDPGGIDVSGSSSLEVSPSATTTYTLTASNGLGTRTRTTTVTVSQGGGVSHRASSQATVGGGKNAITGPLPAGLASGDLLLASVTKNVELNGTVPATTPPEGWTELGQKQLATGSNSVHGAMFYKIATAADLAAGEFTFSLRSSNLGTKSANGAALSISAFSGVDPQNPFDVLPGTIRNEIAGSGIAYADSITTISPNTTVVMLGVSGGNATQWSDISAPGVAGGFTRVSMAARQGSSAAIAAGVRPEPGETGILSASISNPVVNGALMVALKKTNLPSIESFTANGFSFSPGESRTLSWAVSNAQSVTITADAGGSPGAVGTEGTLDIYPVETTTYTITAVNASGTTSTFITLTRIEPGPFRYYRLVPVADRLGIGLFFLPEFQLLSDGVRIPAATATNPGGPNGTSNDLFAGQANDDNLGTYWYNGSFSTNKSPLVYDMGSTTSIDSYRLSSYLSSYDLVSWRFEGGHDGVTWQLIDQQTNAEMPAGGYSADFPVTFIKPPTVIFTATPSALLVGGSSTLDWAVYNADSFGISPDPGIGELASIGSLSITPTNPVTYTLTATNSAGTTTKTVSVLVGTSPVALSLENGSFESNANTDPAGNFGNGGVASLNGWRIIARQNTSRTGYDDVSRSDSDPDLNQVAVGSAGIVPADGGKVVSLMAGAAIAQLTDLKWSTLSPGDQIVFSIHAGDRATSATSNPRWADESFIGLSNGLAEVPFNSSPSADGWILNIVSRAAAVATPPDGYKSGTMGLVSHVHTVSVADSQLSGNVGVFVASVGNRDGTDNGTQSPACQSLWDNATLEVVRAPGPMVNSFTADSFATYNGGSVNLSWDVDGADSITISPGDGANLSATGTLTVSPTATTTYVLTAANSEGVKTYRLTIRVTSPAVARYFRFNPLKVRFLPEEYFARKVALSEFQMLLNGIPLTGATATNPGGSSSSGPQNAIDGNRNTWWSDGNIKPLVLDFGTYVSADGYRFSTSPVSANGDPASWKIEGSIDGTTWFVVDEQYDQSLPTARQAWTAVQPTYLDQGYPEIADSPVINSFEASPTTVAEGSSTTLSWDVSGADQVMLIGSGEVSATGSATVTPGASRGYHLLATNASGYQVASIGVAVSALPRGSIEALYDDASFQTALDGSLAAGPNGDFFPILDVGRYTGDDLVNHIVIPFRLPDLGSGSFLTANLTIRTYGGELAENGRVPISLFAVPGARDSSLPEETDVVNGEANALDNGYLISPSFLNTTTPLDAFVPSGESPGLGHWLNEAYANGVNAGKYVFLRISPSALEVPEGSGFGIGTADDPENMPMLDYVFDPGGSAAGPVIGNFSVDSEIVFGGSSTNLRWEVFGGTSVEINGAPVSAKGSLVVSPADTTTYTLTADDGSLSRTATVTVNVIQSGSFRYLRFTTLGLREIENVNTNDDAVVIKEFQLWKDGEMIPAADAIATNPEGINWPGGFLPDGGFYPFYALDGDINTAWRDFNVLPLVIDYGRYVNPDSYRLGVEANIFDPVSWRIETSVDGTVWSIVHEKFNQNANLPGTAGMTGDFFFASGAPEFLSLAASPQVIAPGGSTTLSWNVGNVTNVSIDNGIGTQSANGSVTLSPAQTTVYTLTAGQGSFRQSRKIRVYVGGEGLVGNVYDSVNGTNFLKPISNLLALTPDGSFLQQGPISYPDRGFYSNDFNINLPGLTSPDTFCILWLGWLDVTAQGKGQYTFGSSGDEASVIYLDLNGDGDFGDAGELVVDNTAGATGINEGTTATVDLQMNKVRIAIGFSEQSSSESMYARYKKGAGIAWERLDPIQAAGTRFLTTEPQAPYLNFAASSDRVVSGFATTLSWSVDEADAGSVTLDGVSVDASGSLTVTPAATTSYVLAASTDGVVKSRTLTVTVLGSGLQGLAFNSRYGPSQLNPISNLIGATPNAVFTQFDPISYPDGTLIPAFPEVLGSGENAEEGFSLLWLGSFDADLDGAGDYTFATRSDDGSVIYIDLNKDGDFADAGELVVDNNGNHPEEDALGVVTLGDGSYNIAIGYYQDGGGSSMEARFAKGVATTYDSSLGLICGPTSHFRPSVYSPPPPGPEIVVNGSISGQGSTYGSPSYPVGQFQLSGSLLTAGVNVIAPDGFEVSLDEVTGYAASIVVGGAGTLGETTVYVRLASTTVVGGYSGEITLTSSGATQRSIPIPQSWVDPREVVIEADNQTKTYGDADPVFTYYTDDPEAPSFVYSGALDRLPGENVGTYVISPGTLDIGPNYSIQFTNGTLTILPKALAADDIALTRNGNAYTASASGVTDFTYSYSGRNGTSYGPSADEPTADGEYTVTATVNDSNFTGFKSEDYTIGTVTPPQEEHPAFSVTAITMVGTVCTMVWESQPDAVYLLEASGDLSDSQSWTPVVDDVASQGTTTTVSVDLANTSHAGAAKLFMRVKAKSPN